MFLIVLYKKQTNKKKTRLSDNYKESLIVLWRKRKKNHKSNNVNDNLYKNKQTEKTNIRYNIYYIWETITIAKKAFPCYKLKC